MTRTNGAQKRPAGSPRPAPPTVPPRRARIHRALIVGAVFVVLAVMIVPTLRAYVAQQSERAQLQAQVEKQQREVDELVKQYAKLNDPAYKEQLARSRLGMVKPGETPYGVMDGPGTAAPTTSPSARQSAPAGPPAPTAPWYVSVYDRMRHVDEGRSIPTATMTVPAVPSSSPSDRPTGSSTQPSR